ncbi:hypothetical protein L0668_08480 [Paraglaciecola aquimarina]|uniref:Uncharacterized protein n=1 Tax=Paraglaciecola algarum TaxID=3050085 RepID=A0ABS9D625_9ALTE|nr:hypothetical protein [Paraglaciecola sp. G1-23]MCF2948139.1 hypothetical protein [Paraglaciecola sp. G1-23]
MKNLVLDHLYTPSSLKEINQDLLALLAKPDPDESEFLQLATKRDEFIQQYLDEVYGDARQNFIKAEIEVNGLLVAGANQLFKASLNQLSGLVRGRKAVKKYK